MKKLIILLGVIGVSFSAIFVRFSNAPAMVLVFYRVLFASIILLPIVIIKKSKELRGLSKKDIFLCMISGVFLGLHFTAYFQSLEYTSIAAAVVLVDAEVFFVAILMLILCKEKISNRGWIAIVITFFGSCLIAVVDMGSGSNVILGDAIALLGAACMAIYTIIGRICRKNITTFVYTFLVYGCSAITIGILLVLKQVPIIGYDNINIVTALAMTICCTLLGHSIFSWGLKYEKPSFIATIKLLEPVFASILGILFFQEVPTLAIIIGGSIVGIGVYLYARNSEE